MFTACGTVFLVSSAVAGALAMALLGLLCAAVGAAVLFALYRVYRGA